MLAGLRSRLSYSNVMSTIACFGVLAGGTAYAANTIGSDDVINDSLLGEDINQGTLRAGDIAANTISSSRILDETLVSQDIKDGSLAGADVADDSLTENDISEQSLDVRSAGALRDAVGLAGQTTQTGAKNFDMGAGGTGTFDVPDFGVLTVKCNASSYNFSYENRTAFGFRAWMDVGGGDATRKVLGGFAAGDADTIASGNNTGVNTTGEAITLRVGATSRTLTIWAFGGRSSSDGRCEFSIQALWAVQ
jgi:hypothetical protein